MLIIDDWILSEWPREYANVVCQELPNLTEHDCDEELRECSHKSRAADAARLEPVQDMDIVAVGSQLQSTTSDEFINGPSTCTSAMNFDAQCHCCSSFISTTAYAIGEESSKDGHLYREEKLRCQQGLSSLC